MGYAHFRIEHNRGHHTGGWRRRRIRQAHASGETIYSFAARELPGAFRRGWANEGRAPGTRRGLPVWSWRNEILVGFALTLAVAAALVLLFGWKVAPFILAHHFMAGTLTQATGVDTTD